MSRLYLVGDGETIARRRATAPAGTVIEAWPDLYTRGLYWLGEESRRLLDVEGEPVVEHLSLPADAVAVYYGPRLTDLDSLPPEDSLKARVLSAHGIAAAWITLDRFGQRVSHTPASPTDPVFHLRRRGGGAGHLWRLFRTRPEAVIFMDETYGEDPEAREWAESLAAEDFDDLLRRHRAP
ncbi:MAG TPA: hypothetical protein VNO23_04990 [Candidatus Binatia bacterium]|nr:hypothetical protein [Candidatus Binatia bacterium]